MEDNTYLSENSDRSDTLSNIISNALKRKELKFKHVHTPIEKFILRYKKGAITVDLYIYVLDDSRIYLRIPFPFEVKSQLYAVFALYVTEYNYNKAFSTLRLSPDGFLSMEYIYSCQNCIDFSSELLERYILTTVRASIEVFDDLKELCAGTNKMSALEKRFYRKLLEDNLDSLYGKENTDQSFGINKLRESLKDPTDALKDRVNKQLSLYAQYGEDNKELEEMEEYLWEEIDELIEDIVDGPSKIMTFEEFVASKRNRSLEQKGDKPPVTANTKNKDAFISQESEKESAEANTNSEKVHSESDGLPFDEIDKIYEQMSISETVTTFGDCLRARNESMKNCKTKMSYGILPFEDVL